MKNALKFLFGSLSTSLLIVLMLLVTIKLELLNKSFLFGSFEKHNVYAQLPPLLASSLPNDPILSREEKVGYAEFIKNISPQVIKPLIEDNLSQAIDYLNGQSKNIVLSFSLNGIGFQDVSSLRWSLAETTDKNLQERIEALNGIGNTLTIVISIISAILVGLFFLSGRTMLLSGGVYIAVTSLISKIFSATIDKELINGPGTSQKLLGLLSSSLFSDITTTWLLMGALLILLWIILRISAKITQK
jgi:hypothetical protein